MPVRLLQVTALAAFFCASATAAPLQIPTNVPIVEVLQTTNSYNYSPVNESNSTIKRVVPISDALITGQSVSDVEPKVSSTRRLPIGTGVNVTADVKIPKANVAKALVATAKGAGKLLLPGLAGYALEALLDYGIKNVKVGEDGNLQAEGTADVPHTVSDGYNWLGKDNQKFSGPANACQSYFPQTAYDGNGQLSQFNYTGLKPNGTAYFCVASTASGYVNANSWGVARDNTPSNCQSGYYIVNGTCLHSLPAKPLTEQEVLDAIASRDGWPSSAARAMQGMLGEPDIRPAIFTPGLDQNLTLQGPNSATGKSTTTTESVRLQPGTNTIAPPGATQTDPGTSTTTTKATHPITYSGNSVSHSTVNNTTTNITNNTTNVTTTQTQTEEIKDDEKPDFCQKHPNAISCKDIDFDTPDGEIPKKQIDVSWSPIELGLGSGSCPAPVQIGPDKQFSYQATCDNLHIIKPMVIAIALFIGGMIIFGGRAEQ